jgi:hypothetical protein
MPLDRDGLHTLIKNCGGVEQSDDEVDPLLAKLNLLDQTGRYGPLLKQIAGANNKDNLRALVLEATFAYQFEAANIPLEYEIKQKADEESSIDFGMRSMGTTVYFELRLLQEDKATRDYIAAELEKNGTFAVLKGGEDEQKAVFKVQSVILSKVQTKDGNPTKFFKVDPNTLNVVAICISDVLLGTADVWDCFLATYGDPEVPEVCRRQVLGLFQQVRDEYPAHIKEAAARFTHFRGTVHAVLFLFRAQDAGALDYSLEQVLVWNRALVAEEKANAVCEQIFAALKPWRKKASPVST